MAKKIIQRSVAIHGATIGYEDIWLHAGDECPQWVLDNNLVGDHVFKPREEAPIPQEQRGLVQPPRAEEPEVESPMDVDYMSFTKADLEAMCAERGLSTQGNKPDLAERLVTHDNAGS